LPANGPSGSGGRAADLARLLRDAAPTSVQRTAAPLIAAGAIAAYEHRVLGLFPRQGHTVTDTGWHATAEHRLRSALAPGTRLDPGTAAFAVLCAVSGIARAVQPPPADRAARHAIASHLNALRGVVGPATAAVLDATVAAYRRSDSGDGFVFVGTGHCYGDEGGDGGAGGGDGGDGGGGGGD
jgi:hypothetical protein